MMNLTKYKSPRNISEKYNITDKVAKKLNQLEKFKMVCVCDDSRSMREPLNNGQTKWDKLRESIKIVIEIGVAFNVECDVKFLNRPGFVNVRSIVELEEKFSIPPKGTTPLRDCLEEVFDNYRVTGAKERKLMVIVFTDGCPTLVNRSSREAINDLKQILEDRFPITNTFVTIVACTYDQYSLEYLNNWDTTIPNLDVVDDYDSKKKQINAAKMIHAAGQVACTSFMYGNCIETLLLGSFIRAIDVLNENKSRCQIM